MEKELLPSWFVEKNFTQNEKYILDICYNEVVIRETEKAILLRWDSKFGSIKRWVPKSLLNGTYQEKKVENGKQKKSLRETVIELLKENNIKMRINNKTETLCKLVWKNGLQNQLDSNLRSYIVNVILYS